jgi:hypothetical protein
VASTIVRTQLGVVVLGIAAATLLGGAQPHGEATSSPGHQPQEQQLTDAAPAAGTGTGTGTGTR